MTAKSLLVTQDELKAIGKVVKNNDIKIAVEIGCYAGDTTAFIADLLREGAIIFGIDNFAVNGSHIREDTVKRFAATKNMELLELSSNEAAEVFYRPIDFLFIDGNHNDDGIQDDIRNWLGKVVSGGIVVFHDYNQPMFPHVKQRVDEAIKSTEWKKLEEVDSILILKKL